MKIGIMSPEFPAGRDYLGGSLSLQSPESSRGTGSQARLIWLGEAYRFSIKSLSNCKVHIFHYVPQNARVLYQECAPLEGKLLPQRPR